MSWLKSIIIKYFRKEKPLVTPDKDSQVKTNDSLRKKQNPDDNINNKMPVQFDKTLTETIVNDSVNATLDRDSDVKSLIEDDQSLITKKAINAFNEGNIQERKQRLIEEINIVMYKELKEITKLVKVDHLTLEEVCRCEIKISKDYFKFYLSKGTDNEIKIISQVIKRAIQKDLKLSNEFFPYFLNQCLHKNENVRLYVVLAIGKLQLTNSQVQEVELMLCNETSTRIINQLKLIQEKVNPSLIPVKMDIGPHMTPRVVFGTKLNRDEEYDIPAHHKEQDEKYKSNKNNFQKKNQVKGDIVNQPYDNDKIIKNELKEEKLEKVFVTLNEPAVTTSIEAKKSIQEACITREIKSLYHITNVKNLPSILMSGILSIRQLEKRNTTFYNNDVNRFDNQLGATCWSISHPNFYYFQKIQMEKPEMKWCIIEIEAQTLWESYCYFNSTNAASNKMRFQLDNERKGINAFNSMFDYKVNNFNRSEKLKQLYPTDIQAEVLIFESIFPQQIKNIYFNPNDTNVYDYFTSSYSEIEFKYNSKLFENRSIYH